MLESCRDRPTRQAVRGRADLVAVLLTELCLNAALMRKESRAGHYREDYPERDDEHWLKWIEQKPRSTSKQGSPYGPRSLERLPHQAIPLLHGQLQLADASQGRLIPKHPSLPPGFKTFRFPSSQEDGNGLLSPTGKNSPVTEAPRKKPVMPLLPSCKDKEIAYYAHSLISLLIISGCGQLTPITPLTPLGMNLIGILLSACCTARFT